MSFLNREKVPTGPDNLPEKPKNGLGGFMKGFSSRMKDVAPEAVTMPTVETMERDIVALKNTVIPMGSQYELRFNTSNIERLGKSQSALTMGRVDIMLTRVGDGQAVSQMSLSLEKTMEVRAAAEKNKTRYSDYDQFIAGKANISKTEIASMAIPDDRPNARTPGDEALRGLVTRFELAV